MAEPKIGRALASGLLQAISEEMPTRLEFYESWLTPARIRDGELGRARVAAVISFLRQEAAYDAVMRRAGRYTADWVLETVGASRRTLLGRAPRPLRLRGVLGLGDRLVRGLHDDVRLEASVRRGRAVVTIDRSLFCDVREPAAAPLCQFYGALLEGCLEAFELEGRSELARCRGIGDPVCELIIDTTPGAAGDLAAASDSPAD